MAEKRRSIRELSPDITDLPFYGDKTAKRVCLEDVPATLLVEGSPSTSTPDRQQITRKSAMSVNIEDEAPNIKPGSSRKTRTREVLTNRKRKPKTLVEEAEANSSVANPKTMETKVTASRKLNTILTQPEESSDTLFKAPKIQNLESKSKKELKTTLRKTQVCKDEFGSPDSTRKVESSRLVKTAIVSPIVTVETSKIAETKVTPPIELEITTEQLEGDLHSEIENPKKKKLESKSGKSKEKVRITSRKTQVSKESLGSMDSSRRVGLQRLVKTTNLSPIVAVESLKIAKSQPKELVTTSEQLEAGSECEDQNPKKQKLESKSKKSKEKVKSSPRKTHDSKEDLRSTDSSRRVGLQRVVKTAKVSATVAAKSSKIATGKPKELETISEKLETSSEAKFQNTKKEKLESKSKKSTEKVKHTSRRTHGSKEDLRSPDSSQKVESQRLVKTTNVSPIVAVDSAKSQPKELETTSEQVEAGSECGLQNPKKQKLESKGKEKVNCTPRKSQIWKEGLRSPDSRRKVDSQRVVNKVSPIVGVDSSQIAVGKVSPLKELETISEELEEGSDSEIENPKKQTLESESEKSLKELGSTTGETKELKKLTSSSYSYEMKTQELFKKSSISLNVCNASSTFKSASTKELDIIFEELEEGADNEFKNTQEELETKSEQTKDQIELNSEKAKYTLQSESGGSMDVSTLEKPNEELGIASEMGQAELCSESGGSKDESKPGKVKDALEKKCGKSTDELEVGAVEIEQFKERLTIPNCEVRNVEVPESKCEKPSSKPLPDFISSENFKIEITNLPSPLNYQEARRLVQEKLQLNARKVKLANFLVTPTIFATFENEEGRIKALAAVNGVVYRECVLSAKSASARNPSLPFLRKQVPQPQLSKSEIEEQVIKSVAPLQHLPYGEQLKLKQTELIHTVNNITKSIVNINDDLKPTIVNGQMKRKFNLIVPLPLASPETVGYRNKCELTIGKDFNNLRVVGHRLAGFKKGCVNVGAITGVQAIPAFVRVVAKKFELFIRYSRFSPYNPTSGSGLYQNLTIRMTKMEEVMLYLTVSCNVLSGKEIEALGKNLKIHFVKVKGRTITSFFLKTAERPGQKERNEPVLVFGKPTVTEKILDMYFEISPNAFFQVNSSCAEVRHALYEMFPIEDFLFPVQILYSQIAQIADLDVNTTLLDVCCGTGTIGLACLKLGSVGQVIGIESCASSVKDAKRNAEINGFEKQCQFYTGRAEDLLEATINMAKFDKIVAIVDPPRAGLASSVISILRKCRKIQKLVFVACKLEACKENFVSFARPCSKKYQGSVFIPERIIPVDMFPHTKNVECILLLNRFVPEKEESVGSSK